MDGYAYKDIASQLSILAARNLVMKTTDCLRLLLYAVLQDTEAFFSVGDLALHVFQLIVVVLEQKVNILLGRVDDHIFNLHDLGVELADLLQAALCTVLDLLECLDGLLEKLISLGCVRLAIVVIATDEDGQPVELGHGHLELVDDVLTALVHYGIQAVLDLPKLGAGGIQFVLDSDHVDILFRSA